MEPSSSDLALAKRHPEAGPLVQAFRPPITVAMIGLILALVGGSLLYYNIYQHMGSAPARGGSAPAGSILAILAFIALIVGFVMVIMSLGTRVLVCKDAVILTEQQKVRVIPWAEVAGVTYSMQGAVALLAAVQGRRVAIETTGGKMVPVAGGFYRNCFVSFRRACKKDFLGRGVRLGSVYSRIWMALGEC